MKQKIKSSYFFKIVIWGILLLLFSACSKDQDKTTEKITDYRMLDGKHLANCNGNASYDNDLLRLLPNIKISHYTNYFDTFIAVTNGSADAAFVFSSFEKVLQQQYPDLYNVSTNIEIPIVAGFSDDANELRMQFDEFITNDATSELIQALEAKWVTGYSDIHDSVDFSDLDGQNGSFDFAVNILNPPYEYLYKGSPAGFEFELLHEFCKKYGLKPNIVRTDYDAVVAGITTGKYDMGMGDYGYTEERSQSIHFSKPYFKDHIGLMVRSPSPHKNKVGFIQSVKSSFYKNFIQEDRWKLIGSGLWITMVITVLSVLIGTILGALLYLAFRKNRVINRIILLVQSSLEALPVLVILMVFYYVIFGKSSISGTAVSVIVFSMMFTLSVYDMLKRGIDAVPRGQTEAGLALGYTEFQTLRRIVLPQASQFFLPEYKGAIVAYLKATAIVGYVAVEDLTKAGDIIRSRTFEAFFPLFTIALIYFLIAKFLIHFLNKFTPGATRRKRHL